MTKLEAVCKMLRSIHEAPVAALDTGNNSVAGLAETYLDEWDTTIQSEGWVENTEDDIDLTGVDTLKQVCSITAGNWTADTLVLNKTAAFASYTWAYGDQIYVASGTGVTAAWVRIASKTDDDNIVLATSIAATDATDIITTLIGWEDGIAVPSDILRIDGYGEDEEEDVVVRGGMLYDREDDTFAFADGLTVTRVRQLPFADLSLLMQRYIVAAASIEFQRRMTGGTTEDSYLASEYADAKHKFIKADANQRDLNMGDSDYGREVLGTGDVTNPSRP